MTDNAGPAHGEITVVDVPEQRRFEARDGDELLGIAEYRLRPGRIVFTHTEVAVEGRGVGSALVRFALDAVRAGGDLAVVPLCPFVAAWIKRHPDYVDLVAEDRRGLVE